VAHVGWRFRAELVMYKMGREDVPQEHLSFALLLTTGWHRITVGM